MIKWPIALLLCFPCSPAWAAGAEKTCSSNHDPFAGKTVKDMQSGMQLIMHRNQTAPKPGDLAPTFELLTADGKTRVGLKAFRGKKPVVLVFGSYT